MQDFLKDNKYNFAETIRCLNRAAAKTDSTPSKRAKPQVCLGLTLTFSILSGAGSWLAYQGFLFGF